jgi:gluconokinase
MADIFNKPVHIKQSSGSDSVAYGGYLVAATEIGLYKNLEDAAQKVKLQANFLPEKQNHDIYMKHYAIFERLSVKLFDEFEAIAELQQQLNE